jgi:hypothetical protein
MRQSRQSSTSRSDKSAKSHAERCEMLIQGSFPVDSKQAAAIAAPLENK